MTKKATTRLTGDAAIEYAEVRRLPLSTHGRDDLTVDEAEYATGLVWIDRTPERDAIKWDREAYIEHRMAQLRRHPLYANLNETKRAQLRESVERRAVVVEKMAKRKSRPMTKREEFDLYADMHGEGAAFARYGMNR